MADKDKASSYDDAAPVSQDFASTLNQLEALVGRLESGELTLEASLAAFERGVQLTRDAQRRLDEAELKVRALTERSDGSLGEVPFDTSSVSPERGHE